MKQPVTRRSFMAGLGLVGSAVVARSAFLLPETMLGSISGKPDLQAPPGVDPDRRARYRYIGGARLEHARNDARSHADVRAVSERLSSLGLTNDPAATDGLEVYWDDGEPILRMLLATYAGRRKGTGGTLIHWSGRDKSSTSIAIWDGDEADRRVYGARGGQLTYGGRIRRRNDGSTALDLPDAQHLIVPTYPGKVASSGKHGLAAAATDVTICYPECNWQCNIVCSVVCAQVLEQTCVMSAACGPLAPACLTLCAIAVAFACVYNCAQYCGWSCQTVCYLFHDPIGTTVFP